MGLSGFISVVACSYMGYAMSVVACSYMGYAMASKATPGKRKYLLSYYHRLSSQRATITPSYCF